MASKSEEMTKNCVQAERELNQALFSRDRSACYQKYQQLGLIYKSMNRDEDAIKCFENGLEMVKGQQLQEWYMYMFLGEVHAKLNHVDYMFECFGLAFDLVNGTDHKSLLAHTIRNLGFSFQEYSKSTSNSIYCWQKALAIASQINSDKFMKDQDIESDLFNLGKAYLDAEQYDESAKYLEMYVKLHTNLDRKQESHKISLPAGNDIPFLAQNEKQPIHGQWCREVDNRHSKNELLARALGLLGEARFMKGNYDDAIRYYKKYLSVAKKVFDNPRSVLSVEEVAHKRNIAITYHCIGMCYFRSIKLKEAAKWLDEALLLAKDLNDRELKIRVSSDLSQCSDAIGENARSISVVGSAKDDIDSDGRYKEHTEGSVEFLLMKSRREQSSHQLSEAYRTAIEALGKCKGDDANRVRCFLQLANVSLKRRSYDDVKGYLDKAWPICDCFEYKSYALNIYTKMHLILHQYDIARENAFNLLEISCITNDKWGQFYGEFLLGMIALVQRDLEVAEKCCREMLKLSSDIENAQCDFKVCELYYLIETSNPETTVGTRINLLFKLLETALKTSETGHMTQVLKYATEIDILFQMADDAKDKMILSRLYEDFLKTGLFYYENISRSYEEYDTHKVSSLDDFTKIHKKLVTFLSDNDETDKALVLADRGRMCILREILRKKYRMAVLDKPESEVLLDEMLNMAKWEKCCIVFYLMLDNCLMIWIISEKGIECQKITKFMCQDRELIFAGETNPGHYLAEIVDNLDAMIEHGSCFRGATSTDLEDGESGECGDEDLMVPKSKFSEYRGGRTDDDDDKLSTKLMNCNQFELLHDWLIAPIHDRLTEDKIVIIPDNFMFQIPFNALRDKNKGKHLVDTKSVRLAPSLMSLQILNDQFPLHKHSQGGALVVAADDVGKVKYDGKEKTFPKIEYAAKEAEMVGKLLKVDPLIGKEATKRTVVDQLSGDHTVLHIAAHGIFPGKILLTPNDTSTGCLPRKEDYMLHMSDVMKIGVRAQLVVLSCCRSGDGPQTPEGIIGFGRAFLAAGARAVLVALWKVKDRATFLLMEKFYQCFVDGKSASDSLNEAVKSLKRIEQYEDEKIWAPYVLFGGEVYWNENNEAGSYAFLAFFRSTLKSYGSDRKVSEKCFDQKKMFLYSSKSEIVSFPQLHDHWLDMRLSAKN